MHFGMKTRKQMGAIPENYLTTCTPSSKTSYTLSSAVTPGRYLQTALTTTYLGLAKIKIAKI